MSKLSAQCDELRAMAVSVGLAVPQAATLMMGAADTIDRLDAENAKLREDRDHWHVEQVHAYGNWEDAYRRAAELETENAKLRELCKEIMAFVEDDDACEHCGHDAECVEAADGELVLPYEGLCLMLGLFADRMRELGVEAEW